MRVEDIHNRRERYTYYLQNSPGIEATDIREIETLKGQAGFSTKVYHGANISITEELDCEFSLPLGSFRNSNDELEVVRINNLSNALIVGPTGSGKSQGILCNTIMNCDGKETVVVIDIKGDICRDTYWAATEIWGTENTHVINFSEPEFSNTFINDLQELAKEWDSGRQLKGLLRQSAWNKVKSKLRKILEEIFPIPEQTKDISWYTVPRNQYWYSLLVGMLEDMSLTKAEEKKTGRIKTTPEVFNYVSICKIADEIQLSGGGYRNQVNDKGWFSKRSPTSEAYKKSYALLHNANSTLANYAGFIEEQKHMISNPKVQAINITNTLDIDKMTEVPGIYYVITDICDTELIDYTNKIMTQICRTLLEKSHTSEAIKGKVPVLLLMDEFPTICKNAPDVYPRLLTTGRASGIYLHMYVQSLSQLRERYGNEYQTLKDNCNMFVFLGTNDVTTAKEFSDDIGRTSIIDQVAFSKGEFGFTTVPAITQDALLHRMNPGEAYMKLFEQMPIHTRFEFFYKTPEFTRYPKAKKIDYIKNVKKIDIESFIYDAPWMHSIEDDDDLF